MKNKKYFKIAIISAIILILAISFYFFLPKKETKITAKQLTNIQAEGSEFISISDYSWSPTEQKIVFVTNEEKGDVIWIVDTKEKNPKKLIELKRQNFQPKWSPSGEQIVFVSNKTGKEEIWIMDKNGNNQKQLTANLKTSSWNPTWSPNGKKIAYFSAILTNNNLIIDELWIINKDDDNQKMILTDLKGKQKPAWNSDGTKILFEMTTIERIYAEMYDLPQELWVINSDGNELKPIIKAGEGQSVNKSSWLPDNKNIIFMLYDGNSNVDFDYSLWIASIDGNNKQKLTDSDNLMDFSLSSDGKKIAYIADKNIWIMDSDGKNQKRLTTNNEQNVINYLNWNPDGSSISFIQDNNIWLLNLK